MSCVKNYKKITRMNKKVKNAIMIGALCSLAYWICYFSRNVLSVVTPQILGTTSITVEFVGTLSTANMICYAIGQLVNGIIGNRVKAKYLVGGGLVFAGVCISVLGLFDNKIIMLVAYSLVGFFLSMLYAPLVKLISENTTPIYAERCCLVLALTCLLGSPTAGAIALIFNWKSAFVVCGLSMWMMGIVFFAGILSLEKRGIIKEIKRNEVKEKGGKLKVLLEYEIIRFSLISMLTGIVRTSVVFWVPTYLSQYMGFNATLSATIFSLITLATAVSPYLNNIFLYEKVFKRNRNKTLLFTFMLSAVSFAMMFIVKMPILNVFFVALALTMNDGASNIIWCVYCPSLRDTGMVSGVTGYLDFLSYLAGALANLLFANAITSIGWGKLIFIWSGLMLLGVFIALPWKKHLLQPQNHF